MLIGLTGGYCSGKNAVAALLEAKGYLCFDLDKLGHEAMALEETMEALAWRFGPGVLRADGSLDRRLLGNLAFADDEALADLEAIVHPAVYRLLRPRLARALEEGRQVCLNAALLYRMPEAARCDAILEVRARTGTCIARGRSRDGLEAFAIRARIRKQARLWRLGRSLDVPIYRLSNDGSLEDLAARLDKRLGQLARS